MHTFGTPGETYKENGLLWANIHKIKIFFNIHLDTRERKNLKYLYMTNKHVCTFTWGFPGSLAGKESTYEARDPGLIPGSGRPPGERIGYPLQYSWVSFVAQLVRNSPAMRGAWIQSLGWEDPLEKGKATHSSILPWRIPWTICSMGSQRVGQDRATLTFPFI